MQPGVPCGLEQPSVCPMIQILKHNALDIARKGTDHVRRGGGWKGEHQGRGDPSNLEHAIMYTLEVGSVSSVSNVSSVSIFSSVSIVSSVRVVSSLSRVGSASIVSSARIASSVSIASMRVVLVVLVVLVVFVLLDVFLVS